MQARRLPGVKPREARVDMGYRGHNPCGAETVHVDKRRRGGTPRSPWG